MKALLLFLLSLQAHAAGKIINADIAPSGTANIARNKLATGTNYAWCTNNSSGYQSETAVTASRAVATDANGLPAASATTATELGYVNGVTSAIQTQLNTKFDAIGNFGSSPTAKGISVSGTTITLQPADATNPGAITTGAQTIAGAKTFSSAPLFSTMTLGSVLFAGTAGVLSQDNSNFFWDDTNNRLGIGTSSPAFSVHIKNNADSYQETLGISNGASNVYSLYVSPGSTFYLRNFTQPWSYLQALSTGQVGLAGGDAAVGKAVRIKNQSGKTTDVSLAIDKLASQTADFLNFNDTDGSTNLAKVTVAGAGTFAGLTVSTLTTGIAHVGVAGAVTSSAVDLASADVTGTLPVGNGGTGATTLTNHGVVIGQGSSAVAVTAAGSSGQPLLSGGASADPAYGTLGVAAGGTGQTSYTDGQLLIGNTSGNTLTKATITAGAGISVTNGGGSITIANTLAAANCSAYVDTGNGHGGSSSGETTVRNYTNVRTSCSDITRTARTTTAGDKFTINTAGTYSLTVCDTRSGGNENFGFTVNGATLSGNITSSSYANGYRGSTFTAAAAYACYSVTIPLAATDVVRVQDDGGLDGGSFRNFVVITRVN